MQKEQKIYRGSYIVSNTSTPIKVKEQHHIFYCKYNICPTCTKLINKYKLDI
jgi:hypothetical protein